MLDGLFSWWHLGGLIGHGGEHVLGRRVGALRSRLGMRSASLVQVRHLGGCRGASDVVYRGHMRQRCCLLPCAKLHLNLQLFSLLRG